MYIPPKNEEGFSIYNLGIGAKLLFIFMTSNLKGKKMSKFMPIKTM
jgi:hypothetical protein